MLCRGIEVSAGSCTSSISVPSLSCKSTAVTISSVLNFFSLTSFTTSISVSSVFTLKVSVKACSTSVSNSSEIFEARCGTSTCVPSENFTVRPETTVEVSSPRLLSGSKSIDLSTSSSVFPASKTSNCFDSLAPLSAPTDTSSWPFCAVGSSSSLTSDTTSLVLNIFSSDSCNLTGVGTIFVKGASILTSSTLPSGNSTSNSSLLSSLGLSTFTPASCTSSAILSAGVGCASILTFFSKSLLGDSSDSITSDTTSLGRNIFSPAS